MSEHIVGVMMCDLCLSKYHLENRVVDSDRPNTIRLLCSHSRQIEANKKKK